MTKTLLIAGVALLLIAGGSGTANAINCKQVNKYLETGRSVKDIAETMIVSESEVEACKAEAAEAKKPAGEAAGEQGGDGN